MGWHIMYDTLKPFVSRYLQRSLESGGLVLDIGCGSSTIGLSLLDDFPKARLLLADVVQPLVERLQADTAGDPRVDVVMEDCRSLSGVQDGSVAVAIDKGTLDSLNSKEEMTACLRAACRVLHRPSGVLVSVSFPGINRILLLQKEAVALGLELRLRLVDVGSEKRLVALLSPSFGDLEDDIDAAMKERFHRMMFDGPLWDETIVYFDRPSLAPDSLPARIELEQVPDTNRSPNKDDGTGNLLWPACHAFCAHLCAHPELVRGKRVVELGAGTGLPGILAAALGATEVLLTDLGGTLPLLRRNVERNASLVDGRARTAELYWGPNASELGKFDVVIACEVLYGHSPETTLALGETIAALMTPEMGAKCLFVYEHRNTMMQDFSFFDFIAERFEIQQVDLGPLGYGIERHIRGADGSAEGANSACDDSDGEENWRMLYVYSAK